MNILSRCAGATSPETRRVSRACLLVALSASGLGCESTYGDISSFWVRFEGSVETVDGAPVEDAVLEFRAMHHRTEAGGATACVAYPDPPDMRSTDSEGLYTAALQGGNIHLIDCVEVRVDPPAGLGLQSVTDTIVPTAGSSDPGSGPVNRVDFHLSPEALAFEPESRGWPRLARRAQLGSRPGDFDVPRQAGR